MNLSATQHFIAQVILLALQFLIPAFFPLTSVQQSAVASFVSAVQLSLAARAYYLNPNGTSTTTTAPKPPTA